MGIPNRRELEKKARREAIITAAGRTLIRKGFTAATMQDIACEAGFAVGTLYLYFKDKESVFARLYLEGMETLHGIILDAAGSGEPPGLRLAGIGRAYLRFYMEQKPLFDVVSYFFSFPEVLFTKARRKSLAARGKKILDAVTETIREGVETGEFAVADPWKEALRIWGSLYGILQIGKMKDILFPEYDIGDLYEEALAGLLKGLEKRG